MVFSFLTELQIVSSVEQKYLKTLPYVFTIIFYNTLFMLGWGKNGSVLLTALKMKSFLRKSE